MSMCMHRQTVPAKRIMPKVQTVECMAQAQGQGSWTTTACTTR